MRGKHHYTIFLLTTYFEDYCDLPNEEKILFQTNKRAEAEKFVDRHYYLEVLDSDWVYKRLWIRKDY